MAGGGNRMNSAADRRSNLQNQMQEGRQGNRGDRQDNRQDNRGDRQDNRTENRGDRQDSRGDRQDNRQENRGDRQGQRQDYRDQRREDWQNWAGDHHDHWGDWHNGYWGSGGWWDHMWDDHPVAMALGMTAWGVNRVSGWFGYGDYSNPYYDSGSGSGYADYSEPVTMDASQAAVQAAYDPATATTPLPPGVSQDSIDKFDQVRQLFYSGQYDEALETTDAALVNMPKDAVLQEFRALCLFALKRYHDAAAVMNAVLAVGPGWDWTTLAGMYPSVDVYTEQLRAREAYMRAHQDSADAHFLLAYHYITMGSNEAAIGQLKKVVALQPKDSVSAYLLASMSPSDKPATTTAAVATAPAVPTDAVVGSWSASGKNGAKYDMMLTKEGAFTWAYSRGGKKQEVKGVYVVDGNSLAMQPDGGGTMLLDLKQSGADLHADIVGAAKGDPGLEFKRGA